MNLNNKLSHGLILFKNLCFRAFEWVRSRRELMIYVLFGGLTTVVDWGISFVLYQTDMNTHVIHLIAWTAAVLFAFATNKIWVFHSQTKQASRVCGELIAFAGGRVLSLGAQEALFVLAVDILSWKRTIVKIPIAVLVVIINYFLTKAVFRRKQDTKPNRSYETIAPTAGACVQGRAIVIGDDGKKSASDDSASSETDHTTHQIKGDFL